MDLTIRRECSGDEDAIRDLTAQAFAGCELGHHGEAELIDRLRASCADMFSLVAEIDDQLVGHILFTPVVIECGKQQWHGMGLGPMSVLPAYQSQRIGSRLIDAGLAGLRETGVPFVVVLGHPTYYPKFGFVPASNFGIKSTYGSAADEVFMIQILSPTATDGIAGVAKYRPEFDTVT
jgi:putative acetyltransferase